MRVIIFIYAVLVWAGDATAQKLDPASLHILISAAQIETSEDLASIVYDVPDPKLGDGHVLWTDTIGISKSPFGGEPAGRAAIARLMEAALIHAGVEPDLVPLDKLSPDDISEMQDAVGFPDDGDLLLYLLRRGPSLRDSFAREGYTAIRHAPEGMAFPDSSGAKRSALSGDWIRIRSEVLPPQERPGLQEPVRICQDATPEFGCIARDSSCCQGIPSG